MGKSECCMVRERIDAESKSKNKIPERVRDVLGPNYNTNFIVLLHISSCLMPGVLYSNKIIPSTVVRVRHLSRGRYS